MNGKVVFFDVGGTLLSVSPSVGHVYASACGRMGATVAAQDVQTAFDEAWVILGKEVPRGANRYSLFAGGEREWWEKVSRMAFERCGVATRQRPDVDSLRAVFASPSAWHIYPETLEALEALAQQGFRLGVISNWDSRLPQLLDRLGLSAHFESLTYSAEAGYEKPHPAIFEAALARFGVSPDDAVHIGDRPDEDYRGAREAGMRALLLARERAPVALTEETLRMGGEKDVVADLREASVRLLV